MKLTILVSTWMLASSLAVAQGEGTELHRHNLVDNLVVGLGPAMPLGNATSYLSTAPFVRFGYGYRFNRLFQADAGVQMAFGAANNQNSVITDFGTVQGADHEFMIPLGGRIYIPLPLRRIQVSAGGGAAYLHYSETVPSGGSDYTPSCYSCSTRGGWGSYGLANVSYFLDSGHNFRVGTTIQYIAGSTNGLPSPTFLRRKRPTIG